MNVKRFTIILSLIVLFAGCLIVVLTVEQNVKERNRDLARIHRSIADHEQQLHMLGAEWEYLNHPDRIRELSKRYLDLQPPQAMQVSADFFTSPLPVARDNNSLSVRPYIASSRY